MIDREYKKDILDKKQIILEAINKASEIIYNLVLEDLEKEDPNLEGFPCDLEIHWDGLYSNNYDVTILICDRCIWSSDRDGVDFLTLDNIRQYRDDVLKDGDWINRRIEFMNSGV